MASYRYASPIPIQLSPELDDGQQGEDKYNAHFGILDTAQFLDTGARRNNRSMIRDFNKELSSSADGGQPSGIYARPNADVPELSFELAFESSPDYQVLMSAASSCGTYPTGSRTSCNGMDDLESLAYSNTDELYGGDLGDNIFHHPASPPTPISEVILSSNHSLESCPTIPRRPFPRVQTNSSSIYRSTPGPAPTPSPSPAANLNRGLFLQGLIPSNSPRPTQDNDFLSSDPLISPFSDHWTASFPNATTAFSVLPFQSDYDDSPPLIPDPTCDTTLGQAAGIGGANLATGNASIGPSTTGFLTSIIYGPQIVNSGTPTNCLHVPSHTPPALQDGSVNPGAARRPPPSKRRHSGGIPPARKLGAAGGLLTSTRPKGCPRTSRGRRNGPMDTESRRRAKQTRNEKTVCIRCKIAKQACKRLDNEDDGCEQCLMHSSTIPCVRAYFDEIILSGSCSYVSHRTINHLTADGKRRIRKELPRIFPLNNIISSLDDLRSKFDIRVHYDNDDRSAYTLNLDNCHRYLKSLALQALAHQERRSFIDKDLVHIDSKNGDWAECMTDIVVDKDPLALLCILSNMPSRVRFSYAFKPSTRLQDRFFDPENPEEEDNLLLAAHLSLIMCRKVEITAYTHLQRTLHTPDNPKEAKKAGEAGTVRLLKSMGYILASLRWRFSWWAVMLGNPTAFDDATELERCRARVRSLCRSLYFYYCAVRRKMPSLKAHEELQGAKTRYPDTAEWVWDAFPGEETAVAFEQWMASGQQLVYEANVPELAKTMGLPMGF